MSAKRKTQEQFIAEVIKVHGVTYDYSKVEYSGSQNRITIICKKHGDFQQAARKHLEGQGCQKCQHENHAKRQEKCVADFIKKHGDKYDYSKVVYQAAKKYVVITCPIHGDFLQTPDKHLAGGCAKCAIDERGIKKFEQTRKKFMQNFEQDLSSTYRLVTPYLGVNSPITVECIAKGHQQTTIPDRINQGFRKGCAVCLRRALKINPSDFIEKARSLFPNLNFDESEFTGIGNDFTFTCPFHGVKTRKAVSFINSPLGCPDCGMNLTGYSGWRLERLEKSGERGKPTVLAFMRVQVFGIESLKIGITTRDLRSRYGDDIKKVLFSVTLDEIDALRVEREMHELFSKSSDKRILKAGMRYGKRWSGDTECYYPSAEDKILAALSGNFKSEADDAEATLGNQNDSDYGELMVPSGNSASLPTTGPKC